MKVIVGMSGGVDSSVAAYLLKRQGYEVEGLSFILMEMRGEIGPQPLREYGRVAGDSACQTLCCSVQAIEEAKKTAGLIGIPHSALDLSDEFMELVVEPFIKSYSKGLTPNPCILCNKYIKFPYLLREAERKGADFIATGHYAITEGGLLKKGIDPRKDQSYVLYALRKEELKRLVLPLGGHKKDDIRAIAKDAGLPVFDRPESQEICFVGADSYAAFIGSIEPSPEGPILDMAGHEIGRHKGIHRYTIGQRKWLGISSAEPLYVVGIDPAKNAITVGPKEAAYKSEFAVADPNWLTEKENEFKAEVKVRSMMKAEPATVYIEDGRVRVIYDHPQWAPAPGQSAVFYEGDIVVGGGVIEEIIR